MAGPPSPTPPSRPPAPSRRHSSAGGVFIAAGALLGAFLGGQRQEPVVGLLIGAAIGIVLAVLVWVMDARRR